MKHPTIENFSRPMPTGKSLVHGVLAEDVSADERIGGIT